MRSEEDFKEWFMDNIADEDGEYNKPVYEAAKWAWEEQQKRIDAVLQLCKSKYQKVDYWVDHFIDDVEELLK